MAAAARLTLLLLGCTGLLQPVGECHGSGGSCFYSWARREPRSSPGCDAGCPSSLSASPQTDGRYISYCPDGWSYYKLSCFKYFIEPRTWEEAEVRPPGYTGEQGPLSP